MLRAILLALSAGLIACVGLDSSARAQRDALMELYGEGVHRFYAGDLLNAELLLTRVIDGGAEDPRAYYFRGLVRECQGGGGEPDFEEGARLEAVGRLAVPVGEALIRIQGPLRAKIEAERRDARVTYREERQAAERARIEALESVPRLTEPTAPAADIVPPPSPAPATEQPLVPTDDTDPFSADGLRSGETVEDAVQPSAPGVDAVTDPFADEPAQPAEVPDAQPAPTPDAADPFGQPSTDPFGGEPAADPFGQGDANAVPSDPALDQPPADPAAADPFGAGEAAAPAAPIESDSADPFGGAGQQDSDPFNGGNPFGDQ